MNYTLKTPNLYIRSETLNLFEDYAAKSERNLGYVSLDTLDTITYVRSPLAKTVMFFSTRLAKIKDELSAFINNRSYRFVALKRL